MTRPRTIGKHRARVGESPVWHAEEACLYHVDILGQAAIRTDIETHAQTVTALPGPPGAVAAVRGGGVAITLPTELVHLSPNGHLRRLEALDLLPPSHRFNDGTVAPDGAILVGTCRIAAGPRPPDGVLWRLALGEAPRLVMHGFRLPNGLAFDPDGSTLFLSDSAPEARSVWRCDWNEHEAAPGPRLAYHLMAPGDGRPDGAAVDARGGYWITATEGGALLRLDVDGVRGRIEVGTARPSKPAFGGPDLNRLFVTTIREGTDPGDALAGCLLEVSCPVPGWPVPYAAWPAPE